MSKEIKINAFKAYEDTRMPKTGKTVVYELLEVKPDPDNKGQWIGSWVYLRPFDTIDHDGKFYDIGIVQSYNTDGSYVLNTNVSFPPSDRFRLTLTPGNPVHEEIYRFMEWCNENESNPNRRPDVIPVFKKINTVAFAKSENEKRKSLFDAQQIFFAMKDAEVKKVADLLGVPSGDEIEVVKSNLYLKLESNTEQFLKVAKQSPDNLDSLVLVKKALQSGILRVDKGLKEVYFGDDDKKVFMYNTGAVKEADLLASLEKDNPSVLEAITAQLS